MFQEQSGTKERALKYEIQMLKLEERVYAEV